MAKKDFKLSISQQWEHKTESVLENKLNITEEENDLLRKKLKDFETHKSQDLGIINVKELKLLSNIRDEFQYEEIELLAQNIKQYGQLQPILITNDNYILAGYRRYSAIKFLHQNKEGNGEIIYYKFNKSHKELSELELKEIQFSENEYRREIDYFQLSKLYNYYKNNADSQKELTEVFKKSKGTISAILKINNIDPFLVAYLKQFQIYAWSKSKYEKFAEANFFETDEKLARFYQDNKGIIGWRPLYEIAKNNSLEEQKKVFLKFYANRLTEEELEKDFLLEEKETETKTEVGLFMKKTSKQIDNIIKSFESLPPKSLKKEKRKEFLLKLNDLKEFLENVNNEL